MDAQRIEQITAALLALPPLELAEVLRRVALDKVEDRLVLRNPVLNPYEDDEMPTQARPGLPGESMSSPRTSGDSTGIPRRSSKPSGPPPDMEELRELRRQCWNLEGRWR